MNRRLAGGIAGLAVAGFAVWMGLHADRVRIERRFDRLIDQIAKKAPESPLVAASRALAAARLFVEEPALFVEGVVREAPPRSEWDGLIFRARAQAERITIRTADVRVQVAPGRQAATLTGSARARVEAAGESDEMVREVRIEWTKTDEGWLIRRLDAVSPVRAPGARTGDGL